MKYSSIRERANFDCILAASVSEPQHSAQVTNTPADVYHQAVTSEERTICKLLRLVSY